MLKEEQGRGRKRRDGSSWCPHECLREERPASPAASQPRGFPKVARQRQKAGRVTHCSRTLPPLPRLLLLINSNLTAHPPPVKHPRPTRPPYTYQPHPHVFTTPPAHTLKIVTSYTLFLQPPPPKDCYFPHPPDIAPSSPTYATPTFQPQPPRPKW